MTKVTRRDFLSRSSALLATGTAVATLTACASDASEGMEPQGQADDSDRPRKDYTLKAHWLEKKLDGTPVKLRAWNGTVPGPLLKARPGDRLNIKVVNNLTPYDSSGWDGNHNVPHDLNSTNLHLHGLEVVPHLFEPVGTTDATAEMIVIPPEGGSKQYNFQIPDDQPPGLFWYHPHKHGSTVVQAVSGMAGGILIEGDIDEVPEIKAAKDNIIVVQDIGLFPTDNPDKDGEGTYIYEPKQNAIWQTFGGNVTIYNPKTGKPEPTKLKGGFTTGDYALRYFLLNGEPFYKEVHNQKDPTSPIGTQIDSGVPTYKMKQGEVARFRILNANSDDVMPIYLQSHDLHLIGMDGVNLPKLKTLPALPSGAPNTAYQLLLAPANRGEFLVKAISKPGIYELRQAPQSLQFLNSDGRLLARIEVTSETDDMALPASLPIQRRHFPLTPDSEVSRIRYVTFGMQFPGQANPVVGIDFLINNAQYDERSISYVVDTGETEDWIIGSPGHPNHPPDHSTPGHQDNTEGHPFHIHVNSFEVIGEADLAPDGTVTNEVRYAPDEVLIQDTIWVPMGKQVRIRNTFKEWTGKSVFHCHILPHEDTGMMQNFLILDADKNGGHGGHGKG
ncbi:multicopper oxidase family protein [Kordiimonas lipolytica]|uniref:Multicopper oxidase family protein n=1 Tax=Kordiimonas lipolytica TaxID=1662421 RepID=A0ABV8UD78_9PROT|nr:multicopper oxidase domain-containing protein [Kordiimonas lipolytica]